MLFHICSFIVQPFDPSEGIWDLKLLAPETPSINGTQGVSIPLAVAFNEEATSRYGIDLVLRHNGVVVGGQRNRYLESPFETRIPGEVLLPGFHIVDVFLVPPGGADQQPVALVSMTIRVP